MPRTTVNTKTKKRKNLKIGKSKSQNTKLRNHLLENLLWGEYKHKIT